MSKIQYIPGNSIIPPDHFGISPSQLIRFFDEPHKWYATEVLGESGFEGSTASILGTIVHFVASEYSLHQKVDKADIYEYLYSELQRRVPDCPPPPDYNNEEACHEFFSDIQNCDVDFAHIIEQFPIMGNALITYLKRKALPTVVEDLISAEVIPGYDVCGSCDALLHDRIVVDYKTTSDKTPKDYIPYNYKLQLLCYAYIYEKKGKPIDTIRIVWITKNDTNRYGVNGKPLKDYPTTITEVSYMLTDDDRLFISSILKLVAESVEFSKKNPQYRHIVWKDYRLKP